MLCTLTIVNLVANIAFSVEDSTLSCEVDAGNFRPAQDGGASQGAQSGGGSLFQKHRSVNTRNVEEEVPLGLLQEGAGVYHAVDGPLSSNCKLPLALEDPTSSRQKLFEALASPRKKTTPFAWLHYGDGDMMTLSGMPSASLEGADLNSQCIRDGVKAMFLGTGYKEEEQPIVHEALGGFFMCKHNHKDIYDHVEMFARSNPHHKFAFTDDFYMDVGNETSPPSDSWVVAAKRGNRPIVLVGPTHLDSLHCMLGHRAYFNIPIPTRGCQDVDRIVPQLIDMSKARFPDESVLFVVAGAAIGKMIAYRAFESLRHKDIFIDVGASLDSYAGRASRDYNHDLKRFCMESKGWMEYNVCQNTCKGIHENISCQQCSPQK